MFSYATKSEKLTLGKEGRAQRRVQRLQYPPGGIIYNYWWILEPLELILMSYKSHQSPGH